MSMLLFYWRVTAIIILKLKSDNVHKGLNKQTIIAWVTTCPNLKKDWFIEKFLNENNLQNDFKKEYIYMFLHQLLFIIRN